MSALTAADLRFINSVAIRRFAGGESGATDEAALAEALAAGAIGSAFVRTASLAAALLQRRAFTSAASQTALLVLHCALSLEGFTLIAPQGVMAGMIDELAQSGDPEVVARWLEDRAVPSASS